MYDSSGWYISFASATAARRAAVVLDKQKLAHHTIALSVRAAPDIDTAETITSAPADPVARRGSASADPATLAAKIVTEDPKATGKDFRNHILEREMLENIAQYREHRRAELAAKQAQPTDEQTSTAGGKLAKLRFTKKSSTAPAVASKRALEGEVPAPGVDDLIFDESPMPSPPKKRRKLKQDELLADFESEEENLVLASVVNELDNGAQGLDKRRRTESIVPVQPAPRKKRKVETSAADLDLDAEVDAMIMEHLDTAPARKPKTLGRKKKKQSSTAKAESVAPESIMPDPLEREPTAEITIPETDLLVEPEPAAHVFVEMPKPAKRRGKQPKAKAQPALPPDPPPDPFELGIEDDEELYLLQEGLRRRKAGLPEWGVDFRDPADDPPKRHPAIRVNATGSARTEGYYKIPEAVKSLYLPDRNKAKIDVGTASDGLSSSVAAGVSSRSTRVESRHFARGVEQANKLLTQLGTDSSTELKLKFNQLRTRKKKLKFARSPIHDWGLYAMEPISSGEMVIEYVGELIRQQVADKREKYYEQTGIGSSYLFRVDDDAVVDATKKGNLGYVLFLMGDRQSPSRLSLQSSYQPLLRAKLHR